MKPEQERSGCRRRSRISSVGVRVEVGVRVRIILGVRIIAGVGVGGGAGAGAEEQLTHHSLGNV